MNQVLPKMVVFSPPFFVSGESEVIDNVCDEAVSDLGFEFCSRQ